MTVLVDTNVILDSLLGRDPHYEKSNQVVQMCAEGKIIGYLAAHTVTNTFFFIQKQYDIEDCRDILRNLLNIFSVERIDAQRLRAALSNTDFTDLEDSLQHECALEIKADYIVTRNKKDFKNGSIPCVEPSELCEILDEVR